MNRLKELLSGKPEPERSNDYFEIEGRHDVFVVTGEVAAEVERRLGRLRRPRWITFRDLFGARHCILAGHILRISECTAAQRAKAREFHRVQREESKGQCPWEEDHWI